MRITIFIIVLCIVLALLMLRLFLLSNRPLINQDAFFAFNIPSEDVVAIYSLSNKYDMDFATILSIYLLDNDFYVLQETPKEQLEQKYFMNFDEAKKRHPRRLVRKCQVFLRQIFYEIQYFPIRKEHDYVFENTWGAERTYGGRRTHQGTDIIATENIPGLIEVISMTDGIVKNIGWNERGGWRVGIETKNGNYYYYAHLHSYANIQKGDTVAAGQVLGLMGNTGYGPEGTTGEFCVHLHVGIEVIWRGDFAWINPYPFLRFTEQLREE